MRRSVPGRRRASRRSTRTCGAPPPLSGRGAPARGTAGPRVARACALGGSSAPRRDGPSPAAEAHMKPTSWSRLASALALAALSSCSSPTTIIGAIDAAATPADVFCAAGERGLRRPVRQPAEQRPALRRLRRGVPRGERLRERRLRAELPLVADALRQQLRERADRPRALRRVRQRLRGGADLRRGPLRGGVPREPPALRRRRRRRGDLRGRPERPRQLRRVWQRLRRGAGV